MDTYFIVYLIENERTILHIIKFYYLVCIIYISENKVFVQFRQKIKTFLSTPTNVLLSQIRYDEITKTKEAYTT